MGITKEKKELEKLKEKLKKQEEKNRRYKKALANKNLIERWKIGEYLHNDLAQLLAAAKISTHNLKDKHSKSNSSDAWEELLDVIEKSITEVRNLSHEIIPLDVKKEGIEKALIQLKRQAENQYNIKCRIETDKILHKINSRIVATNLCHITQEAIKNAVIHGEANHIKIALIEHEQQLYLHVKNDGKRFDPSNNSAGIGIAIMKYRAEELGGSFRIKDAKDNDYTTCVTCTLPLESPESE